jgi:hypothetical protein
LSVDLYLPKSVARTNGVWSDPAGATPLRYSYRGLPAGTSILFWVTLKDGDPAPQGQQGFLSGCFTLQRPDGPVSAAVLLGGMGARNWLTLPFIMALAAWHFLLDVESRRAQVEVGAVALRWMALHAAFTLCSALGRDSAGNGAVPRFTVIRAALRRRNLVRVSRPFSRTLAFRSVVPPSPGEAWSIRTPSVLLVRCAEKKPGGLPG